MSIRFYLLQEHSRPIIKITSALVLVSSLATPAPTSHWWTLEMATRAGTSAAPGRRRVAGGAAAPPAAPAAPLGGIDGGGGDGDLSADEGAAEDLALVPDEEQAHHTYLVSNNMHMYVTRSFRALSFRGQYPDTLHVLSHGPGSFFVLPT